MIKFYKDKSKLQLQVGFVFLLCLTILFFSYGWLINLFENEKFETVYVAFPHSNGINQGSPVSIFGVNKGRVESIAISQDGVIFSLRVELDEPLKDGTTFTVQEIDLMGNKNVDITPSKSGQPLDMSKVHKGFLSANLNSFIVKSDQLVNQINLAIEEVRKKVESFEEFPEVIAGTKQMLEKINNLLDNFMNEKGLVSQVDSLVKKGGNTVNQATLFFENLNLLVEEFKGDEGALSQIEDLIANTKGLIVEIEDKQGSLGKLIYEEELYEKLLKTTTSMDTLLIDIKQNPKRYFKISLF